MQLSSAENEELTKYLIHIGARLDDIFAHLQMRGIDEQGALALLSLLMRRKEIFRDNTGRLFLTNEPREFPQHIVANVASRTRKMFARRF